MPDGTATLLQGCLDRLRAGDPAARDELIRLAGERLRRLTHIMLGEFNRVRAFEQTDDVLQNALVRLLRALEAVPLGSVAEFFRLAAAEIRRELIDLSRHYYGPHGAGRHERRLSPPADDSSAPPPEPAGGSTFATDRLAAWTEFHRQVEGLPEEERAVFDLLYYQGLPQADAAAVLGVSVPTVKRRWMAARLRLQVSFPVLPR